jgi:hypothetical protein
VVNEISTMPWRHTKEWSYSSTILDLGIRWSWVVSFTHWLLLPRQSLDRRLGVPQSRSEHQESKSGCSARRYTNIASFQCYTNTEQTLPTALPCLLPRRMSAHGLGTFRAEKCLSVAPHKNVVSLSTPYPVSLLSFIHSSFKGLIPNWELSRDTVPTTPFVGLVCRIWVTSRSALSVEGYKGRANTTVECC